MYLHLYFNPDKLSDDGKAFNRKMDTLKAELLSGKRNPEHEKDYRKYFEIKETPKRGIALTFKQDAIDAAHERYGFFVIYLSYIQKRMDEKGLFSTYTMHELLDELDVIECFMEPGKAPIQGEVLKKQEQIYRDMDVVPLLAAGQGADA